jgi:outer membrane protein assembly factor BamD
MDRAIKADRRNDSGKGRARSAGAAAIVAAALLLAACGSTREPELPPAAQAERLYKEARDDIEAGAYDRAIQLLGRIEGLAAGSLLAQQALLDLAYANWRSGEKAAALSTIDRFIKLNPSSPALDYAYYLRGVINFNDDLGFIGRIANQDIAERDQRAARDAWQSFKQLVDQFPQSRYAADARLRMNHILHTLAAYEVHVARYYFRRGAYLAAANRAQAAVTEFQQAPAVEEALFILVQSYDKLQMTTLRDAAERVLKKNFPDSDFLSKGFAARDKAWWKFW